MSKPDDELLAPLLPAGEPAEGLLRADFRYCRPAELRRSASGPGQRRHVSGSLRLRPRRREELLTGIAATSKTLVSPELGSAWVAARRKGRVEQAWLSC